MNIHCLVISRLKYIRYSARLLLYIFYHCWLSSYSFIHKYNKICNFHSFFLIAWAPWKIPISLVLLIVDTTNKVAPKNTSHLKATPGCLKHCHFGWMNQFFGQESVDFSVFPFLTISCPIGLSWWKWQGYKFRIGLILNNNQFLCQFTGSRLPSWCR